MKLKKITYEEALILKALGAKEDKDFVAIWDPGDTMAHEVLIQIVKTRIKYRPLWMDELTHISVAKCQEIWNFFLVQEDS